MDENIIQLHRVSKTFLPALSFSRMLSFSRRRREKITALDNVSFTVRRGKIAGLLGPNGAGKTTLLKILSTLILPDSGTVRVHGYDPEKNESEIKARVGLVSGEERNFYWRLTGRQNLEFFAAMHGLPPAAIKAGIEKLLETFNITYAGRRFDTYSAGMKRSLALARALLHNPRILLLDEPTKSLDYNTAAILRKFIRDLGRENKTIILATHDMEEAGQICDEYIILHRGTLRARGTLDSLRTAAKLPAASLADIYLRLTEHAPENNRVN